MSHKDLISSFKAYDIRGKLNVEIDEELAFKIGYAIASNTKAQKFVVGYDARESSPKLSDALMRGISVYGSDILNIGHAGTEEVYCAVDKFSADAGVEVTASHNPIDYNGFKIVKSGSQPLTEFEFAAIRKAVLKFDFKNFYELRNVKDYRKEARQFYIEKLLSFIDLRNLKPLTIVINSGNGSAGPVIDALDTILKENNVETNFKRLNHLPDPSFPNGIPNPMLDENQHCTSKAVKNEKADFGVAFDGDFDRCFLFDNLGNFISGEYLVGLLAKKFLQKEPGATIVHDPRVIWNITDVIKKNNGRSNISKPGHTFLKAAMRNSKAVYGGEISAHHYFRDFYYCDSGMIPWIIIWELLSLENVSLSDLIAGRKKSFPSSGEINFEVLDPEFCLWKIHDIYAPRALSVNLIDGFSFSFNKWRFNVRKSNTEPLVRLNVEVRGSIKFLNERVSELKKLILN